MNDSSKTVPEGKWNSFLTRVLSSFTAKALFEFVAWICKLLGVGTAFAGIAGWLYLSLQENWQIASSNVVIFIGYVVLWVYRSRKNRARIKELLPYKSIGESCGIEGIHPLKTAEEKKAGWEACVEKIGVVRYDTVRIAVFTGASTFTTLPTQDNTESHQAPLRKALDDHEGRLEILLMQPDCDAWKQCIGEFAKRNKPKEEVFRQELRTAYQAAYEFCNTLADKPWYELMSIEVRVYDRPPLWKMLIMGQYIWLQHYARGAPVDGLPAYVVRRGVKGGMAYALQSVFDYRWKNSSVVIHRDERGTDIRVPPGSPLMKSVGDGGFVSHTPQASVLPAPP